MNFHFKMKSYSSKMFSSFVFLDSLCPMPEKSDLFLEEPEYVYVPVQVHAILARALFIKDYKMKRYKGKLVFIFTSL